MSAQNQSGFGELTLKTVVAHTITYMFTGVIAYNLFNYSQVFATPQMACWMRPMDDPLVMAGVLFQPIRGVIFALAFYPFREILFVRKKGWLIIFWTLIALGIFSTFGPAPGSVEGMIYTIIPLSVATYAEVVTQAFLLSGLLFYWITHPNKHWLSWTLGILFILTLLMPVLGLLVGNPASK